MSSNRSIEICKKKKKKKKSDMAHHVQKCRFFFCFFFFFFFFFFTFLEYLEIVTETFRYLSLQIGVPCIKSRTFSNILYRPSLFWKVPVENSRIFTL